MNRLARDQLSEVSPEQGLVENLLGIVHEVRVSSTAVSMTRPSVGLTRVVERELAVRSYSARSASTGSIRLARDAGITQAMNVTTARTTPARVRT